VATFRNRFFGDDRLNLLCQHYDRSLVVLTFEDFKIGVFSAGFLVQQIGSPADSTERMSPSASWQLE
jgi:hypothetical protein